VNANRTRALTAPVTHAQVSSPDMRWLAGLPHHDSIQLPADETAPRDARRRLAKVLLEWSLPQFETVAALIASELVTNAMLATREVQWAMAPPPIRLWLRGGPSVLAIAAWDAAIAAPVPRDAGDGDESGRGVAIIDALSAQWGFYYPAQFGGKVTWAVINTP
jgi:anti-sigma regulatory factor (Ser/Thr protein kinase)